MPDAVLTGVETRTSSPLRIPRGKDYQSLNVRGLYPAGEGAGYAGGIMSAGVDGIEVAEALGAALLGVLSASPYCSRRERRRAPTASHAPGAPRAAPPRRAYVTRRDRMHASAAQAVNRSVCIRKHFAPT